MQNEKETKQQNEKEQSTQMTPETQPTEQTQDDTQSTQLALRQPTDIKLPDAVIYNAMIDFMMGKSRTQIAQKVMQDLPEELQVLQEIDTQDAKKIISSKLRSVDPKSTKFAEKYRPFYKEAQTAVREAIRSQMQTYMNQLFETLIKDTPKLHTFSEQLITMIDNANDVAPKNNKEYVDTIKAVITLQKAQADNLQLITNLFASLEQDNKP